MDSRNDHSLSVHRLSDGALLVERIAANHQSAERAAVEAENRLMRVRPNVRISMSGSMTAPRFAAPNIDR